MGDPIDIVAFWWRAGPEAWFASDPAFDETCREKFLKAHEDAASGTFEHWQESPHGALALILLLDQMPRNMFRGTQRMFATDADAVAVSDSAIRDKYDQVFPSPGRRFFYMPYMHAEDIGAQTRCIDLCRADGDSEGYKYALIHMDPIRRFGRFPHRNEVLGRKSTPEEEAYMQSGGFKG